MESNQQLVRNLKQLQIIRNWTQYWVNSINHKIDDVRSAILIEIFDLLLVSLFSGLIILKYMNHAIIFEGIKEKCKKVTAENKTNEALTSHRRDYQSKEDNEIKI